MFKASILLLVIHAILWASASANTEIRNFEVLERPDILISETSQWQDGIYALLRTFLIGIFL